MSSIRSGPVAWPTLSLSPASVYIEAIYLEAGAQSTQQSSNIPQARHISKGQAWRQPTPAISVSGTLYSRHFEKKSRDFTVKNGFSCFGTLVLIVDT